MNRFLFGLALLCASQLDALLVVNKPSVIVREEASMDARIEDICRYSTPMTVIDERGDWLKVTHKNGDGWLLRNELLEVAEDPNERANAFVATSGAYFFKVADTEWGPFLYLPFEAPVEVVTELPQQNNRWVQVRLQDGQMAYAQRSQLVFARQLLAFPDMISFSKQFLGTNYLWGGTTSFGYDCSGFVQMLYRQMGVTLPRNSKAQAADPQFINIDIQEADAGDLVFFENSSGKVVHVGMMINKSEFIQAFTKRESWICIGLLDDDSWRNGTIYYGTRVRRLKDF